MKTRGRFCLDGARDSLAALGLVFFVACGGGDGAEHGISQGGTDGQGGGMPNAVGAGGATSTGSSATTATIAKSGGSSSSGGLTGASVGVGGWGTGVGGLDPYWTNGYDPTKSPTPADGSHNPGQSCITIGCHDGSEPKAPTYLLAGTVLGDGGFAPAANVEIGASDGSHVYFAYSAGNGNFWVLAGAGTLDFTMADVRIVNSKGQKSKLATSHRGPDCNSCHAGTATSEAKLLLAP